MSLMSLEILNDDFKYVNDLVCVREQLINSRYVCVRRACVDDNIQWKFYICAIVPILTDFHATLGIAYTNK